MLRTLLYRLYERQLLAAVRQRPVPRHLGLIQDGHRRYAREGRLSKLHGYRLGARNAEQVLAWCAELGIPMVTLWCLSTENLERDPEDLGVVLEVIGDKTIAALTLAAAAAQYRGGGSVGLGLYPRPLSAPWRQSGMPRWPGDHGGAGRAAKNDPYVSYVAMRITDPFLRLPQLALLLVVFLFLDRMRQLFGPEWGSFC